MPFVLFAQEGEKEEILESITMAARKAEESAKNVPFSLTVIGGSEIENRRLKNFEEPLKQTPGVEIHSYGGINTRAMRIRGVSTCNGF